ncbi:MAG: polysaccharide biosynthesis tyrosine autokinase [Cyanobacteria bacterium P01_G01_bin.19]
MLSNNSNDRNINSSSQSQGASRDALDVNPGEYLVKLKRRWKPALAIFLLTLGVSGGLSLLQKKTYQGQGKLVFKQASVAAQTGIGENVGTLETILPNQTPISTQIQVLESEPVIQQVIDRQKLTDDEGNPLKTKDFRRSLSTELIGGTDVVEVRYKHSDPKVASDVVNSLMDVYIQEQIQGNQSEPEAAKEFINQELPSIESKVEQAEQDISAFRTENNIVDLAEEKKGLVANLGDLNQQISTTGSELQGLQAQTSALQGQLGLSLNQAVAANQLSASPEVQSILEQLNLTESNLAQERQRFNEEHPSIVSLNEKKNDLNNQLKGLVASTIGQGVNISQGLLQNNNGIKENQIERFITLKIEELSLQRQVTSLYESQQEYLQRAKELPILEQREQELVRNAEAAGTTLETLLDNLQKAEISASQESGNAKVVEYSAVPEEGSSGRIVLLGLGLILGVFLSNLSVVLLEMQDRTLKTLAEVKKKFAYQTIGITPLEPASYQDRIVTREEPDSFSSEVYRMIQANLKFLTSGKPPKVILVTSSVPEEGKSTVTANLAAAIAQLGREVLLIDADLRRSSQHRLWGTSNKKGLKDIIVSNVSLNSVLSKPMPKLNLLTSGMVNSNPLALLDSPALSDLVGRSRRNYDLILIDAPPLPVTADVLTLSKLVDGIVFVTRPGVVEQESAELAQETLNSTGQKVLGMIINGVKPADFDRYSYHGRYGKSYHPKNIAKNQERENWQNGNQGSQDLSNPPKNKNSNQGGVSRAKL